MKTFIIRRARPVAYIEEVTIEVEAESAEAIKERIQEEQAWENDLDAADARIKDGINHEWSDMFEILDPENSYSIVNEFEG
jgi:hypothetical protein